MAAPPATTRRSLDSIVGECMYGVIQSVLLVPICISFATIIYRDPFFSAHLPMLIKLVTASCAVHQTIFCCFSTLPFAVGQVQDAGLIFLSAMASSIVAHCTHKGADDTTIISTVLVTLSLATFLLGCLLIVIARLKLASLVQYLPMPVIGGYLAYIGFFCGQAGLALMASVEIVKIEDWRLLGNVRSLMFVAPGILMAVSLYVAVRKIRRKLTMPTFLVGVVAAFYIWLFVTGTTLDEVRDAGWVSERTALGPCWEGWSYLDVSKVDWAVVPTQAVSWLAMVLVVAFSSSLDVAAIEMEIGHPLDYDHELKTVGISNAISGALGGYTGSYIFSQTIFNLRAKVESRLTGMIIIFFEALVFLLPVSPMAYIPKCFFGSLLLLIAMELCMEWLWGARHKMMLPEYVVNLLTFVACLLTGVEQGIVLGCVFAMCAFIFSYARIPAITALPVNGRSTVMRTFEERVLLRIMSNRVLMLSMRGYIFFGSSVRLLEDAKLALRLEEEAEPDPQLPLSLSPKKKRRQLNGMDGMDGNGGRSRSTPRSIAGGAGKDGRGEYGAIGVGVGGAFVSSPNSSPSFSSTPRSSGSGRAPTSTFEAAALGLPPTQWGTPGGGIGERTSSGTRLRSGSGGGGGGGGGGRASPNASKSSSASSLSAFRKKGGSTPRKGGASSTEMTPILTTGGGDVEGGGYYDDGYEGMGGGELQMAVMDFSGATGLDASAARSCFLMLKQVLRQHDIRCVFVVSSPDIRALLVAHQVIETPPPPSEDGVRVPVWQMEEPVFESLDDALEWCEEQLLYEIGSSAEADASSSSAPPSSSPSNSPSRKSQPVPPKPPKPPLSKLLNPQLMSGRSSSQGRGSDPTEGGDAQMVDPLSRHPSYYFGLQQSRISPTSSASLAATAEGGALSSSSAAAVAERPMPPTLGSPMALVSILEDYLQIAPAESPLRTAAARTALATHFERATFQPGDVLLEAGRASDRLFLIERGTVDLVIIAGDDRRGRAVAASSSSSSSSSSRKIGFDGKEGSRSSASIAAAAAAAAAKGEAAAAGRYAAAAAEATDGERGGNSKPSQRLKRLQRISGGGICGELGFFLEAPQAFSAVAVRPTAVWTLSRRQFTDMQVADAQLCILVQMALVKSLALSASQNLEGTRHRQLTEG